MSRYSSRHSNDRSLFCDENYDHRNDYRDENYPHRPDYPHDRYESTRLLHKHDFHSRSRRYDESEYTKYRHRSRSRSHSRSFDRHCKDISNRTSEFDFHRHRYNSSHSKYNETRIINFRNRHENRDYNNRFYDHLNEVNEEFEIDRYETRRERQRELFTPDRRTRRKSISRDDSHDRYYHSNRDDYRFMNGGENGVRKTSLLGDGPKECLIRERKRNNVPLKRKKFGNKIIKRQVVDERIGREIQSDRKSEWAEESDEETKNSDWNGSDKSVDRKEFGEEIERNFREKMMDRESEWLGNSDENDNQVKNTDSIVSQKLNDQSVIAKNWGIIKTDRKGEWLEESDENEEEIIKNSDYNNSHQFYQNGLIDGNERNSSEIKIDGKSESLGNLDENDNEVKKSDSNISEKLNDQSVIPRNWGKIKADRKSEWLEDSDESEEEIKKSDFNNILKVNDHNVTAERKFPEVNIDRKSEWIHESDENEIKKSDSNIIPKINDQSVMPRNWGKIKADRKSEWLEDSDENEDEINKSDININQKLSDQSVTLMKVNNDKKSKSLQESNENEGVILKKSVASNNHKFIYQNGYVDGNNSNSFEKKIDRTSELIEESDERTIGNSGHKLVDENGFVGESERNFRELKIDCLKESAANEKEIIKSDCNNNYDNNYINLHEDKSYDIDYNPLRIDLADSSRINYMDKTHSLVQNEHLNQGYYLLKCSNVISMEHPTAGFKESYLNDLNIKSELDKQIRSLANMLTSSPSNTPKQDQSPKTQAIVKMKWALTPLEPPIRRLISESDVDLKTCSEADPRLRHLLRLTF